MQQPSHENPQRRELLRVCRIGRAQGLRGDMTVQCFTDEPERRFSPGSTLYTDERQTWTVAASRVFKGRWILRLAGIDDRNAAESLRDTVLFAPADTLADMERENAWYPADLVGLEVRMADANLLGLPAGAVVGTVSDVHTGSAQSLLEISLSATVAGGATEKLAADGAALVPFVQQLVPVVDLHERYLTINPPFGLIPALERH